MDLISLVPLVPAAGAALNGLLGIRWFSRRLAASVACASMAVAFGLSAWAFLGLLRLEPEARTVTVELARWIPPIPLATAAGIVNFEVAVGAPPRSVVGGHDPCRHGDRAPHSRLLDGLHAGRAARSIRAVLLLPEPVLLLHAHPRSWRELPGDVRRAGRASGCARTCSSGSGTRRRAPRTRARKRSSRTGSATGGSSSG